MSKSKRNGDLPTKAKLAALLLFASSSMTACETMGPAVATALVGFGHDVLASAAQNFTPQYADSMQNLLFALAEGVTGVQFSSGGSTTGDYAGDEPDYSGDGGYEDDEYSNDGYAQSAEEPSEDYYPTNSGVDNQPAQEVIHLDAAILAQQVTQDNRVLLNPVRDGDVLYDGRGDPTRGDKIKLYFAANCECYVYIVGIDATGYVAQIFPEGSLADVRPVRAGQDYLVPGGRTWWGLDSYRGVENIYFIVSRSRRTDIERIVSRMAGTRPPLPDNYRPVQEPATIPVSRGLVQVQDAAPTSIPTEFGGDQQIRPTGFQNSVADADLVVSRWFRHR